MTTLYTKWFCRFITLGIGQLWINNEQDQKIPIKINKLENIILISCGYQHSLALLSEGFVYSFGYNIFGQQLIKLITNSIN
jgi:alpha-tubulin suppressor-like RCC1 family protein